MRFAKFIGMAGISLFLCSGCKPTTTPTPSAPAPAPTPTPPPTPTPTPPSGPIGKLIAVPISDVYDRDGIHIELHDGYPNNPSYHLTADEKSLLWNALNTLPAAQLRGIKYIGTLPDSEQTDKNSEAISLPSAMIYYVKTAANSSAHSILLDGVVPAPSGTVSDGRIQPKVTLPTEIVGLPWFFSVTVHELGHNVLISATNSAEKADWDLLHTNSSLKSDYAPDAPGSPPYLDPPYGSTKSDEDFATTYAEFALYPAAGLLTSLDTLQSTGRGVLLQKYLYMMSLFADSSSHTINFTQENTQALSMFKSLAAYTRTSTGFQFSMGCSGLPADCVPMDMNVTLNASNAITGIEYTDARTSKTAPRRVTLTPPQPIPLPSTMVSRMSLTPGANATSATTAAKTPSSAELADPSFASLIEDLKSAKITSPFVPTHYDPIENAYPALPTLPPQPTLEELLRPHGHFKIASPEQR